MLHRTPRLFCSSRQAFLPVLNSLAVELTCCLLLGLAPSALADVYPKIEASFSITNLSTDPFDYTMTDVRVQILQPDATTLSLPSFFDGGTLWRVRHTPTLPGLYHVTGVSLNGQPLAVSNLQPSSWTVGGAPTSPGFVRVDPANPNRFINSNGQRFFPIGHDVAWWTNNTVIPRVISKMGVAHENWSRIWMTHFYDSLNLEWPKVGSLGQFSLSVAQKWDAIVSAAETNGVFFQMTLQHHGQYSTTANPNWNENPYNTANGGFLSDATLFFTTAGRCSSRRLRRPRRSAAKVVGRRGARAEAAPQVQG
jgi:hypothetical protein